MPRVEIDSMIGTTRAVRNHHAVAFKQEGRPAVVLSVHPHGEVGELSAQRAVDEFAHGINSSVKVVELCKGDPYFRRGSMVADLHGVTDLFRHTE